nr:hypothetical protein [Nitrosomonas nitrosa]
MQTASREIYISSNGDRWLLVGDRLDRDIFVRHVPAPLSGGRSSEIDIGSFLSRDHGSPQHQRLVQMIWELVEDQD